MDAAIRKQEVEEYLYKEQFKGLDAEEAKRVGDEVKLGGEVVEDETATGDKTTAPKRMPTRLRMRMQRKGERSKNKTYVV